VLVSTNYNYIDMRNFRIALVVALLLTGLTQSKAQFFKDLKNGPWVVGVGWNIVDDNGSPGRIFTVSEAWNMLSYPSSIRVEKDYKDGFSFIFMGSYNKYSGAKIINSETGVTSTFMAFDLGAKYNFMNLYNINQEWFNFPHDVFDIYSALSLGVTMRNTAKIGTAGTINVGFGMNAFIYKGWGINLDAQGKFGFTDGFWSTPANYTQYSFGIIKKFGGSGSSGKGLFKPQNARARTKI